MADIYQLFRVSLSSRDIRIQCSRQGAPFPPLVVTPSSLSWIVHSWILASIKQGCVSPPATRKKVCGKKKKQSGQFTEDAMCDWTKESMSTKIRDEARLLVEEKRRESGDRGTAGLNFITNLSAFPACLILLLQEREMKESDIKKKSEKNVGVGGNLLLCRQEMRFSFCYK